MEKNNDSREKTDWRSELLDETDPDDELLTETPKDVVETLGFDPLEMEEKERK